MAGRGDGRALLSPTLLILVALPLLSQAASVPREAAPRAGVLDGDVIPERYEIHIEPEYKEKLEEITDFKGTVVIELELKNTKRTITLNAAEDVLVETVSLEEGGEGNEVPNPNLNTISHEGEKVILTWNEDLKDGKYTLTIKFSGKFQPNDMVGFYKSAYPVTINGVEEKRYLFTTKFEPTHARKAFPCFDEPSFKARFRVSVNVPKGYSALSNTDIDTEEELTDDEGSKITFKETEVMSTYLVAYIIYEKESVHRTNSIILRSNVRLTAWGPAEDVDQKHKLDFSQIASRDSVDALEAFTGIPYNHKEEMTKIDQVAIKDFASGAMENWGLITYREAYIYYSEEDNSEAEKKNVATTHSHELAHQWFGNLVTMKWWDNTWLNEGFARFFQYYALAEAYPKWRMMEQLLVDQQQGIFVSDAEEDVKPLTHDVETFEEIRGQFGSITYNKGASFLRMVYYVMGEENFREALRTYLRERYHSYAEPSHLWNALNEYLPKDVQLPEEEKDTNGVVVRTSLAVALESWTLQPGFPVLAVKRGTNGVTFSQTRFLLNGKADDKNIKYWIPVSWSLKGEDSERKTYLMPDGKDVTVGDLDSSEDYILVHSRGYYRVNYDETNWLSLANKLIREDKNTIAAMDRAQLVDDAFTLAQAGYAPYAQVVPLLKYLSQEDDPLPWVAAFRAFTFLDRLLAATDTEGSFHKFIKDSIHVLHKGLRHGKGGTHIHKVHEANIILWACRSGHADCLEDAENQAAEHLSGENRIKAHLRNNILCYAVRHNGDLWEEAFEIFKTGERSEVLAAVPCTNDETRLEKLLTSLDSAISDDELTTIYSSMNSHPEGLEASLNHFINNFASIKESNSKAVSTILLSFGQRITLKEQQETLTKFLEGLEEGDLGEGIVDKVTDAMTENLNWVEKYADDAIAAFAGTTTSTENPSTEPSTNAPGPGGGGQATIEPLPALLGAALLAWLLRSA